MAKTIVFCADGTWNGPGDADPAHDGCAPQLTNVCKLFSWLDGTSDRPWGSPEMEKVLLDDGGEPLQLAKYIHGVGDTQAVLDKVAGGAFGVGVVARIARGYTYVSRQLRARRPDLHRRLQSRRLHGAGARRADRVARAAQARAGDRRRRQVRQRGRGLVPLSSRRRLDPGAARPRRHSRVPRHLEPFRREAVERRRLRAQRRPHRRRGLGHGRRARHPDLRHRRHPPRPCSASATRS